MDFYGINLKANLTAVNDPDLATGPNPLGDINAASADIDTVTSVSVTATTLAGTTVNATTVNATTLNGTATYATWGDLAEKYLCKSKCDVGTVICVSKDEVYDVEPCNDECSAAVIGVISEKPGFGLNSEADGEFVGLTGKLPVKIIGPINKSDFIVPATGGCARAGKADEIAYKIGVANETNPSAEVKLVNCVIK